MRVVQAMQRYGLLLATLWIAGTAQAVMKPMSSDEYDVAQQKIEAKADKAQTHCKTLEGDAKSHCQTQARGERDVALAVLLARYRPSANNSFKASSASVELQYALALDNCKPAPHALADKAAKAAHKACRDHARAERTQGFHDAHEQAAGLASLSTPPKSEAERQREADLDTAIRKCDSLLGEANLQCVRALSPAARQRAAERINGVFPPKE